jgi:hypothetical protein
LETGAAKKRTVAFPESSGPTMMAIDRAYGIKLLKNPRQSKEEKI